MQTTTPRFFQFSISALLFIVVCAAIGGYFGQQRAREIRYQDFDTGEERVCHSRLEVIHAINKKIREFTAEMARPAARNQAKERLSNLIKIVNFLADDQEFAAATGPSSPAADKYEWSGPSKYAFRYVDETNGTFQLGLGITWPSLDQKSNLMVGTYVMNALVKSTIKTATEHSENEYLLAFPLENAKWFTLEREPGKVIALSALKGLGAGLLCWFVVRLIIWSTHRRGTQLEPASAAQDV